MHSFLCNIFPKWCLTCLNRQKKRSMKLINITLNLTFFKHRYPSFQLSLYKRLNNQKHVLHCKIWHIQKVEWYMVCFCRWRKKKKRLEKHEGGDRTEDELEWEETNSNYRDPAENDKETEIPWWEDDGRQWSWMWRVVQKQCSRKLESLPRGYSHGGPWLPSND